MHPPMPNPRARVSQERSRARREQLLEAALELFAEGGARAVTHRAVAARAGLPSATPGYYFGTVEELLRAALSHHVQTWVRDMRALAAVPLEEQMHLDDARDLVSFAFAVRTPSMVRMQLATFLAASADPLLQPLAAEALEAVEELATTMLASVGLAEATGTAAALVQLMIGAAATRLAGLHDDERVADVLFDAVRRLVATAVMDPAVITDALESTQGDSSTLTE